MFSWDLEKCYVWQSCSMILDFQESGKKACICEALVLISLEMVSYL
jgi:hypothetical protein